MLRTETAPTPSTSTIGGWLEQFEARVGRHRGRPTRPLTDLSPAIQAGLESSLPTFQLGETGDGSHLREQARSHPVAASHLNALVHFIDEEREHARLLSEVMCALGIPLVDRHWTDLVFQSLRRVSGLRTELLTLMVAEVIALRFYAVLRDGVGDPTLAGIFGAIQADEEIHVRFHTETLPPLLSEWSRPRHRFACSLWSVTVTMSTVIVAIDHRRVLGACGVGQFEFVGSTLRRARAINSDLWRRV